MERKKERKPFKTDANQENERKNEAKRKETK